MAALALHPDLEHAGRGHAAAGGGTGRPGGHAGPDMLTVDPVHAFHGAGGDHVLRTLGSLLSRLEGQLDGAAQFVLYIVEDVGRRQQRGCVAVMAAGVHAALLLRFEGEIILLDDGQSVHVAAEQNGLAGFGTLDGSENAGAELAALYVRNADFIQLFLYGLAGLELLGAQFGIAVESAAHLNDIVGVFLRAFLNIQAVHFLWLK